MLQVQEELFMHITGK